jgi:glycosyltransferase involved in cell wall biosynthesis
MKVTHVLAPAAFGGLERVVYALSTGQQRRGHEVQVVMLLAAGVAEPTLAAQLRDQNVAASTMVVPRRAYWTHLRLLAEHFRNVEPDVIHTHGYLPDVLSRVLMRRVGARRVSTVHGFVGGTRRGRLYEWLQCRAYRRIDAVAVSRRLAADLVSRGVPKARVHIIVNAVDSSGPPLGRDVARERLGVSEGLFSVGWVGRVSYEKGLDVLLEALNELRDLPIRLTIVGDGAARTELEQLTSRGSLRSMVHWAGILPDPSRLMSAFDVLVLSSRTEGTPMALLEAMAAAVPVVATAVGGIPDVLTDEHGLLVPSEDPLALANAIRAVYLDRTGAARRASAARSRLNAEFSVNSWLDSYDRLYEGLPDSQAASK